MFMDEFDFDDTVEYLEGWLRWHNTTTYEWRF